jgi:PAS domain S-box-containing protein
MKSAPKHPFEEKRLESLKLLEILDTLEEKDFDEITLLASQICDTPIALISLIDEKRQWFKSKVGIDASETPREFAFCAHAILQDDVFHVEDSLQDQRFFDNPLVIDGPRVHFYAGAPLLSPDGMPIGTLCVIDSHPRKLSERQKKSLVALSNQVTRLLDLKIQFKNSLKAEEKLKIKGTALMNITEGVVLQDQSGSIIDFNPAALTVLGLTAGQLLGKTSMDPSWCALRENGDPFPGEEHPAMQCLKTGLAQKNVTMIIKRNGSEQRWLKINSVPLSLGIDNKMGHAVTSFSDITEQVDAKNLIIAQQEHLRQILDTVPAMIGKWGADLINLSANNAYLNYFGKTPEEMRGRHMKEILGAALYESNIPYIKRVLKGENLSFERDLVDTKGVVKHTLANFIPCLEKNNVVSFLVVVVDISEVKTLEKKRRVLELKLIEASRLSNLGVIAGGMAHEINNPLTIIKGKISILKRRLGFDNFNINDFIKELEAIEFSANRIANIIKEFSLHTKDSSASPFSNNFLKTIIAESLVIYEGQIKNTGVKIISELNDELTLVCRLKFIEQAVGILIKNSLDAITSAHEKWIKLKVVDEENVIKILVIDSGEKITDDVVKQMMVPFFTTKAVGEGMGLGLTNCKNIIESQHGQLDYLGSEANTTFMITLPKNYNVV